MIITGQMPAKLTNYVTELHDLTSRIFDESIPFEDRALDVFNYQYKNNKTYRRFCDALKLTPSTVEKGDDIPLLPAEAFKDADLISFKKELKPDLIFKSSGTSSMERSTHAILDEEIYRTSVLNGFEKFYNLEEFDVWAYLPGYSDNPNSSLLWMVDALIEESDSKQSRFLPLDEPLRRASLKKIEESDRRLMLFGAAFGLLDLLELDEVKLPENSVVVETGGMKTHRREITKSQLHTILAEGFGLEEDQIHSEYGMTEMCSQAYAVGGPWLQAVPWLKVSLRDPQDPLKEIPYGEEGLIGCCDLANIHSCSFLLTGDKGIQRPDGAFQVLGRWQPKNLRGCNFLMENEVE